MRALDPCLQLGRPLRTEAEALADRRVLGSLHTREAFERQGYHVPAEHLASWRGGLCDERGRPTMKAHRVNLDNSARRAWTEMHNFRAQLMLLEDEPQTPNRDQWIERMRLSAREHAANLRRILAERRALKRATLPMIRQQQAAE